MPWSERRRRWSWKEKAEIVAESLAPNAVETAIARRYGLHRNQLYAWRKELRETANDGSRETANDGSPNSGSRRSSSCRSWYRKNATSHARQGIEIELSGARVRVSPG